MKIGKSRLFTSLELEDADWARRLEAQGETSGLQGTIIVAPEGINSTCAGSSEAVDALIALLRSDARFADLEVKYSQADFCPFEIQGETEAEICCSSTSEADLKRRLAGI